MRQSVVILESHIGNHPHLDFMLFQTQVQSGRRLAQPGGRPFPQQGVKLASKESFDQALQTIPFIPGAYSTSLRCRGNTALQVGVGFRRGVTLDVGVLQVAAASVQMVLPDAYFFTGTWDSPKNRLSFTVGQQLEPATA
ncbi:MAG TPA: hypothetical protein VK963_00150 [Candidatus Saccharimonadales bacterium]|nr:hypothetical protein [Candidatus Saccharimonadales bacterium]